MLDLNMEATPDIKMTNTMTNTLMTINMASRIKIIGSKACAMTKKRNLINNPNLLTDIKTKQSPIGS